MSILPSLWTVHSASPLTVREVSGGDPVPAASVDGYQPAVGDRVLVAFVSGRFYIIRPAIGGSRPRVVGAAGEPAFENGWSNLFADDNASFIRVGRIVALQGILQSGTYSITAPMFTLPVGYRPAKSRRFPVLSSNNPGRVTVFPDGKVTADFGTASGWVDVCPVQFLAEQ